MLVASYVFYAWWDWRYVFLLAGVSTIAQVGAIAVARQGNDRSRSRTLVVAVVATIAPLLYFKYYGFFSVNTTNVASSLGLDWAPPLIQVVLPVGISFYTFMAISYVVDVYRRDVEVSSVDGRVPLPRVLPPPRRGSDRSAERADPAARRPARPAAHRRRRRRMADPAAACSRRSSSRATCRHRSSSRCSATRPDTARSRCSSASGASPCRSMPTSAATPTSRSASRSCSGSASR